MLFHASYILFFIQILQCETLDNARFQITIERPSDQLYSTATEMCCNGITQPKSDPHMACCGNQTFNPVMEFCCNDSAISETSDLRCCYNQLYNTKTHDCSVYVEQAKISKKETILVSHHRFIIVPITKGNDFPCGNGIVDLNTSVCCNGNPIPLSGVLSPKCCGDKLFDPSVDFCCYNYFGNDSLLIIPKVNYTASCCNGKPFDQSQQICISSNSTIVDLPDNNTKWCNDQFIDIREAICCPQRNILTKLESNHTECCGNATFTPAEEMCCNDNLIAVSEGLKCCLGSSLYDPTKDICCASQENIIVTKQKSNHTKCCGNATFSPAEEMCCNGKLIALSSGMKCCPGNGPYDPKKDTCCTPNNTVTSEKKSKLFNNKLGPCCYLTAYNETKESCCGIFVIPKSANNQSGCCEYNLNYNEASLDELIAYKYTVPRITMHSNLFKKLKDIRKSMQLTAQVPKN